ncbi:hypothetical protein FZC78_02775 [Rossellomorea vietnamensis]|uniref:Uncharacterized protein n=1 Tax=Rossellomorea vietnamensis TaxID=218284 RepID=A0A5D4NX28_9BACI|nr:hypothetical protein [Rossellomorea vietnamensis]TYS18480.1 hypothetical protein FZC78_02775 [Rossellomorea vietnamensis]
MKKELWYIQDQEVFIYTLIGFQEPGGYGEVHIKSKTETIHIFRGYERRKVLKEVRRELNTLLRIQTTERN